MYWAYADTSNPGNIRYLKGNGLRVKDATSSFVVRAVVLDENSKLEDDDPVYASSEIEQVIVRDGLFARLKAFFRSIFGKLPKVVQTYLGVEIIERTLP